MTQQGYTEDQLVQQTTADYLRDALGWESVYAYNNETFGPEGLLGRATDRDIVLTRYLGAALIELNPGLPDTAYREALRQITEYSVAQSPLGINRDKYKLLKDGVSISFRNDKGAQEKRHLRIFDFDQPENNHFLAVRELWIKGDLYRRRADIVGFVNGIPLLFMELKNVHLDIQAAYEQNLADYKDTVPHLFHHNAFIVLANGVDARIGSLSSRFEHFSEWKRLAEEEPGVVDMETLLKGVCSKRNFMDVFENFIVFDDSRGQPIKIIARNHQYLGVNRAVQAVSERESRLGKLGVFWHTQGSGKSYSMVFFARKIHRKLGGHYTFLICTDRDDLDGQIYDTFAGCGLADNDRDPCRAGNGAHLQALLSQHKAFVFTLIQKFNRDVDPQTPYSFRSDIIVISDEAHRTQYGRLALNMRNALPNAAYIGFTGTPLFQDDEITRRIFGDYVSTYDFQRAVQDKATVPLYYDARGEKLDIATEELNEKVAAKLEELEVNDIDVQQRLERALKRDYHVLTADKRLDQIAEDFVEHYSNGWEMGKTMLVCIDKITCVRMYNKIQQRWTQRITELESALSQAVDEQDEVYRRQQLDWMKATRMAVVVSEEQGEVDKFRQWELDITPHRRLLKEGFELDDGTRLSVENAFKRDDHPFRVAIVCAMWLTGFDVPSLAILYLDKPLKAHTLMQAIARANRVNERKNNGLIVDYCGILKNLRKALATFAGQGDSGRAGQGGDDGKDPTKPNEELLADLAEAIALVQKQLVTGGASLDDVIEQTGFTRNAAISKAKDLINKNDQTRKRFEIMARKIFQTFKACLNIKEVNHYRQSRDAINIIYQSLQADREKADISAILQQLQAIVDEAIETQVPRIAEKHGPYDISRIDFDRLRKEFERSPTKHTTVQNLKHAIEQKLHRLIEQNPLRTDLQRQYEEIIKDYNREKDAVTIEQTFDELCTFVQNLDQEEQRAVKEGLDQESLALFDLLRKPSLEKNDIERIKKVATELLAKLKTEKLKIDHWRAKQATRDDVRTEIYNFLYDETTGLPVSSYTDDEIADITDRVFSHIYRVYDTLQPRVYQ